MSQLSFLPCYPAPRRRLRSTLIALLACSMVSCIGGHRFHLKGHEPVKRSSVLPPLVLLQGETRLVISEWGRPMKWGFSPGLACGNESVVRVDYQDDRSTSGTVFLRGMKPGATRVWYVNGFAHPHPHTLDGSEGQDSRIGFDVKVLPPRNCANLLPHP